ncbi:hypothetical protein [Aquimarina sp. AU474]|uniref:hypothetical protein n=1 Tax=Aquimarina sp. AU474 TaxID=2108529 RepID=UPI00135A378A|nr:hypothetical protein [Aquimarina sp. AU474]
MINKIIFIMITFVMLSCQKPVDIALEKKKIQDKIDLVVQAHYNKDAIQFFESNANEWYDVRNGIVQLIDKSEKIPSTQKYLDNMDFHEMIQRNNPVIEISDDATLASYLGSITIKGVFNESPVLWVVAWQSVLKKNKGEWEIISTTNTEGDNKVTAEVLLDHVRKKMGVIGENDFSSVYAYAKCRGPERSFETLLLSNKKNGRMEQLYEEQHIILKHGENTSWTRNLSTNSGEEKMDNETMVFVNGHELHWLSFWPEHRYKDPVFKGISKFNDKTAFQIEFKDVFDKPVHFYYSFNTYLPLGFVLNTNPNGDTVDVTYNVWEKINNVQIFKKAAFKQGNDIFEYNFTDIKVNQIKSKDFENKTGLLSQY